jgi:hypothetical protein
MTTQRSVSTCYMIPLLGNAKAATSTNMSRGLLLVAGEESIICYPHKRI